MRTRSKPVVQNCATTGVHFLDGVKQAMQRFRTLQSFMRYGLPLDVRRIA